MDCKDNEDSIEQYFVSARVMDIMQHKILTDFDIFRAMIDSGANISMAPLAVAEALGLKIYPPLDDRTIGTAEKSGHQLVIVGWIYPRGFTGPIALVETGFLLLSTCQMQCRGMSTEFPMFDTVCHLSTCDGWFATLDQCVVTRLYYIDVRCLLNDTMVPYVKQVGDVPLSVETLHSGWAGCILIAAANDLVVDSHSRHRNTKRRLASSTILKVWRIHRLLHHAKLETIANDIESGLIINADVAPADIRLVAAEQDCFSCALSKWNKLKSTVPSGVRSNIIGQWWSMDYNGPYSVLANGGFSGEFIAVELSCGYIVVFLVKSKKEAVRVAREISLLCKRFGHRMEKLRVDFGTVERGAEFIEACSLLNTTMKGADVNVDITFLDKGVEVLPAAPGRQQQNPVERHIQHYKNLKAANMVDQDLLGASFWGWAGIATAKGMNSTSNTLCPGSNPLYLFEGKRTNLARMFKHSFGQPVICHKLGLSIAGCEPKNEFGVVVCPGHASNGTSMIHFPSAGTRLVSPRFDVREIRLGNKPQMSFEKGKDYLPQLAADGSWHLVTRGDSNILAKQIAASIESEHVVEANDTQDALLTTTFNSSIAGDEVFSELAKRGLVTHVPLVNEVEQFADIFVDKQTNSVRNIAEPSISLTANPASDSVVPSVQSARPIRSTSGKTSMFDSYVTAAAISGFNSMLRVAGLFFSSRCSFCSS